MKKKNIIILVSCLLLILVLVGAFFLFKKSKPVTDSMKFSEEYNEVAKDNVFVYSNIDEIVNLLENGTGIVFLAFPECPWCQNYAKYLNEVAKENNIKKIYYLNIKYDRQINSSKYTKLVKLLGDYLYADDSGIAKVYAPDLTFVKNGKIIAHDNETSITTSSMKIEDYWTEENILEFKNKISNYIREYDTTCSTCN